MTNIIFNCFAIVALVMYITSSGIVAQALRLCAERLLKDKRLSRQLLLGLPQTHMPHYFATTYISIYLLHLLILSHIFTYIHRFARRVEIYNFVRRQSQYFISHFTCISYTVACTRMCIMTKCEQKNFLSIA